MLTARSQAFSLGLHVTLIAALLLAASRSIRGPLKTAASIHATPLTFFHPRKASEVHSGGSNRTEFPAKRGVPPPKAQRTFIPPTSTNHPLLPMPITISFDIPTVNTKGDIGDPFSHLAVGALGQRGDNSIGNGCCGGIGDAPSGTPGIAAIHKGRGVTPPQLIYKVEPEFSEDARKAKHQGVVLLSIVVDANGNVRNIRLRQGLGLGLDEKAMDAVSRWRFRPGVFDGKPVATEATVEVHFQLL
jgi:periplasmic protein TonB